MEENKNNFPLSKEGNKWIIGGIAALIIGFMLMSGGGVEDPSKFNEEIFSARRITVAPLVVLIGYFLIGFGIMKKPKQSN